MRTLFTLLAALIVVSPASAIKLTMIGQAAPKVAVYRQSETTVVVYDARPEMGISLGAGKTAIGALDMIDVRMARVTLELNTMEPTEKPGVYDSAYMAKWDKLVEECRQRGVCLVVAIKGDAPGVDKADAKAQSERLARFAGDMAQRYPSVTYWELGENANYCLSGDRGDATPEEQGKTRAQMLKQVCVAIKAANPGAQIVCSAASAAFAKGIYDSGPIHFFDIMCVNSDAKGFADTASAFRKMMSPSADDTKPLWCLYTDGFEQQKLEEAFRLNNASTLYQKILVESTGSGEQSAWLLQTKVNSTIDTRSRSAANVFIATKSPMTPIGYDFKKVDGGIEIQHVVVDSLVPTVIHLMYAPEPPPAKPGVKPAPKPKSNGPQPDPWDI